MIFPPFFQEKEGRSIDLSLDLTVTSLSGSSNGFGLAGMSLGVQGSASNWNKMELMEPDSMMMEENNPDPVDNENQEHTDCSHLTVESSQTNKTSQVTDVTMESPR